MSGKPTTQEFAFRTNQCCDAFAAKPKRKRLSISVSREDFSPFPDLERQRCLVSETLPVIRHAKPSSFDDNSHAHPRVDAALKVMDSLRKTRNLELAPL